MTDSPDGVARLVGVSHRYRAVAAVDDISLELPAGRMMGFIGPDAVGKSTVLALIAGVRQVQTGTVTVLGGYMTDRRHRHSVCPRIA